jgi:diguanylate cyclase (GGDEF)-like protein
VVRVLLVVDSAVEAEFITGLLSKALYTTHHVTRVQTAAEALDILENRGFDVLLLDLALPGEAGLDALHGLIASPAAQGLPVVVLAESSDEGLALEATNSGALDYLIKGEYQARILIRALQRAVSHQRMLDRLDQAREREIYLSTHDQLTGLPNRYLFTDRLAQSLHSARRNRQWLGVLILDIDRFHAANDAFGHAVGDQLLQAIARRLVGCLRATDTAARVGGNEYAVLLPDLSQGLDAAKVASNIEECLRRPFRLSGQELMLTVSIGIAVSPEDGSDAVALMSSAHLAMKSAKREGGDTRRFYTAGMNASAARLMTIENDLRNAIEVDQEGLQISLQPIVDGRGGKVTGAEALMRWTHPTLGTIAPAEFIPVAEARGLIVPLGSWVMRHVCQQIRRWQNAGITPVPIAVNVSPRQFWNADFLGLVMQSLMDTGVDGRYLEIEITESCLIHESDLVADALDAVQQLNVRTSIDDFGTGFSSLGILRRLPLDSIKIDRGFVRGCTDDGPAATVVGAIINLARSLGLQVIAEGVESGKQRDFLLSRGCVAMQGFLYSRPVTPERFTKLIESGETLLAGREGAGEPELRSSVR